jgi:hypothetical protein
MAKIIGKYDNLTRDVVKLFLSVVSFHNNLLGNPSSLEGCVGIFLMKRESLSHLFAS